MAALLILLGIISMVLLAAYDCREQEKNIECHYLCPTCGATIVVAQDAQYPYYRHYCSDCVSMAHLIKFRYLKEDANG